VEIRTSARKHGVADEDMLHAVRNSVVQRRFDEHFTMCTGAARNTNLLLEVGVLDIDSDDPLIIHAMLCRPQYLPPTKQ
jgi:hypothetical protein